MMADCNMNTEYSVRSLEYHPTMKINARITKEFRLRAALAILCFRLGCWIIKSNIEIIDTEP